MDKNLAEPHSRSLKRVLLWVAVVITPLLLAYSYRYELILAIPSVQAGRLRLISNDTQLPFPPSSRVVKFEELGLEGPFPEWRFYWISWFVYWESWRCYGARWYDDTADSWYAKVMIPDSSYVEFKDAVLKKPNSPFRYGPYGLWAMERQPIDPEFKRIIVGRRGELDCVEVLAQKQDGKYAIYVEFECK